MGKSTYNKMDAIRKKMQSLKGETDSLYATIARFEGAVKEANGRNDQHEADIRDLGKKIQTYEVEFDETNDKLTKVLATFEEKEKEFKNAEEDVGALSRRVMLMEEEAKKADTALAETVTKLATMSKEADGILKKVKYFESKRATERAELAEGKLKDVETELETIGENMKQLEISAEKATEREEKLKDKILNLMERFKVAEARYEYGESNITKLNHRIDDIEDEIYREKLKIKKVSDELGDTFDDMLANY